VEGRCSSRHSYRRHWVEVSGRSAHDMGALFPVKEPAGCGSVTPDRNILPLPRIERRTLSRPAWRSLAKQQIAYSFDHWQHRTAAICGPPVRLAVVQVPGFIATLVCRTASCLLTNCQRIGRCIAVTSAWSDVCGNCYWISYGTACRDFISRVYLSTFWTSPSRWGEPALLGGCQVTGYRTWLPCGRK
jgi:hypothetical protein